MSIEAAGSVRSSANTWKWYYDRVAAGPGVQLSLQSGRSAHSLSPAAPFSATRAADESIRGSNSVHERSAWLRLGRRDGPGATRMRDIAVRRCAEQAAVLAAELRSAFIPHTRCRATGIEVLVQHQLPQPPNPLATEPSRVSRSSNKRSKWLETGAGESDRGEMLETAEGCERNMNSDNGLEVEKRGFSTDSNGP